jgi:hypothetical protein
MPLSENIDYTTMTKIEDFLNRIGDEDFEEKSYAL